MMEHDHGYAASLTVVIPLHNEAGILEPLVEALDELRYRLATNLTVILVDDCSSDDTRQRLAEFGAEPWIETVRLGSHGGQHRAVLAGFRTALSREDVAYIATMDADLDPHPRHFVALLPCVREHDLVIGRRAGRRRTPGRMIVSFILRALSLLLRPNSISDHGSMFRLYDPAVAADCIRLSSHGTFVAGLSILVARTPIEIPIPSESGRGIRRSRYSASHIVDAGVQMIRLIFHHPLGLNRP